MNETVKTFVLAVFDAHTQRQKQLRAEERRQLEIVLDNAIDAGL